MPVYVINTSARPTKVAQVGGDWSEVYPADIDFSEFRDFGVLPDGTIASKEFAQQGLPIRGEYLPKELKWGHGELKEGVHDFLQTNSCFIASEKFRNTVEALEPGIHQFVEVKITWKNGEAKQRYYWLFPCNRIDSIHDQLCTYDFKERNGIRRWQWKPDTKLVFDLQKIGNTHMWLDRGYHNTDGINISETLKNALEDAKITGVNYYEFEAA